LLDYLARNLQERYVDELRRLLPLRPTSATFHRRTAANVDHGPSIRERSKKPELLKDPEHLPMSDELPKKHNALLVVVLRYWLLNDRTQSVQSHTIVSSGGGRSRRGPSLWTHNVRRRGHQPPIPFTTHIQEAVLQSTERMLIWH
jgi:hypothetical protein